MDKLKFNGVDFVIGNNRLTAGALRNALNLPLLRDKRRTRRIARLAKGNMRQLERAARLHIAASGSNVEWFLIDVRLAPRVKHKYIPERNYHSFFLMEV